MSFPLHKSHFTNHTSTTAVCKSARIISDQMYKEEAYPGFALLCASPCQIKLPCSVAGRARRGVRAQQGRRGLNGDRSAAVRVGRRRVRYLDSNLDRRRRAATRNYNGGSGRAGRCESSTMNMCMRTIRHRRKRRLRVRARRRRCPKIPRHYY